MHFERSKFPHPAENFDWPASRALVTSCHGGAPHTLEKMENRKGNVRGKYARFINENPRFINEPIYNISYTIDSRASVSDCMKWTTNENKKNHKKKYVI